METILEYDRRCALYDRIISATYVNMFTMSKESMIINIDEFNPNDKIDNCILEMALLLQSKGIRIGLQCSIFQYIKTVYLQKRFKKSRKIFKRISPKAPIMDVFGGTRKMIEYVANCFDCPLSVYADIYDEFYSEKGEE